MRNSAVIYFFLSFLAAGLACALPALRGAWLDAGAPQTRSGLNGAWSAQYDKKFPEHFAPQAPALLFWGKIELALFHQGRGGVLIGQDGWLFSAEEFQFDKNSAKITRDHLRYIRGTAAALAAQNIKLAVILLPAKARALQDHLGRPYPSYAAGLYPTILRHLKNDSIPAVDLAERFSGREDLFLKSDTHWTPAGAREAAAAAKEQLRGLLQSLALPEKTFKRDKDFKTTRHAGDLSRYVPAGSMLGRYGIGPETVRTPVIAAADTDDLFGDSSIPVTLIGTSYSANPLWGFTDELKLALRADILNAADEGRGPFETMRDYLASPGFKSDPPKLVLWEIPERYLPLADKTKLTPAI